MKLKNKELCLLGIGRGKELGNTRKVPDSSVS